MQSVPFRVIDANALSMERQNGRSSVSTSGSLLYLQAHVARASFPGAVDDNESSVWTSNRSVIMTKGITSPGLGY